jgi:alkylation response protein AidB-like acyl-CoA dehydrogenase
MSVTKQRSAETPLGFSDYIEAARRLQPLVASEADEAERLRHLTDATVAAFREAELYRMLLSRELGGPELPWVEAMEVLEAIGLADGSASWCLMVGALQMGGAGAYLPDAGVATVFAHAKDPMIAGQGIPNGVARPIAGGYRIDGDWSYGSGIHHADFVHTGCILLDGDDQPVLNEYGIPEVLICHVHRKDIELKDNWDVLGLRATGSYDYSIRNLEVPTEMVHPLGVRAPRRGSYQYTLGLIGLTAWGHTGFALGVGRHALDEIAKLARTKANVFGLIGEGASFQERYARAEATYRGARELCYAAWTDICETLARERPAGLEQIALIRLAMRHVHEVVSDVCTFAHIAGGGVSLRPSALQRCYRDIHAATQHILLSDQLLQDAGRVLMGLASEGAQWTMIGLRQPTRPVSPT